MTKHVICEKPVTINSKELEEIISASEKYKAEPCRLTTGTAPEKLYASQIKKINGRRR